MSVSYETFKREHDFLVCVDSDGSLTEIDKQYTAIEGLAAAATFVNAYGSTRTHIRAAIEKICGKSEFKGIAGETVFCGRWDTRL